MTPDRPILGILLMLGFCILAPVGDAMAKLLGGTVPLVQIVLIRFAVQAAVLIPLVWATRRLWRMRGRVLWLTFLRTILHVIGIATMITALVYLPLADAIAIVFVMPFFMLILGRFVLKEEVGPRRILACAAGFSGTLLVVQPSFIDVGWPAVLPILVALVFSLFMLLTRQIAKETDPIGLQAVSGVMAVGLMLPLLWLGTAIDLPAVQVIHPTATDWSLLLGIGVLGTLAHLMMTWSLRFAPTATLAPMQYLEIPFATLIGLMIFADFPDPLAALGMVITMGAGVYVLFRERASARDPMPETQPQPAG